MQAGLDPQVYSSTPINLHINDLLTISIFPRAIILSKVQFSFVMAWFL